MLRTGIAVIHAGLAAVLGMASAYLLAQATLNRAWETSFYGTMSPATGQILNRSWAFLGVSAVMAVVCWGYARRWRWSGPLLAGWSTVLLFTPLQVLGLLTLAAVLLEAWTRRSPPPPPTAA
jgi:hypothetical protein